jgi:hypothetical protein
MNRALAAGVLCIALAATTGCAPQRGPATALPARRAAIATTPAPQPARRVAQPREFPVTLRSISVPRRQSVPGVLRSGTRVPSVDVGVDVPVSGDVRFGLADQGSVFGNVYPVMSADAGAVWLINGPRFSAATAGGGATTDQVKVARDGTLLAWGRGGNFVKASTDRGRHWVEADFFGGVESVKAVGDQLIARALGDQTSDGRFRTRRYVSRDSGRTWRRGRALPAVRY